MMVVVSNSINPFVNQQSETLVVIGNYERSARILIEEMLHACVHFYLNSFFSDWVGMHVEDSKPFEWASHLRSSARLCAARIAPLHLLQKWSPYYLKGSGMPHWRVNPHMCDEISDEAGGLMLPDKQSKSWMSNEGPESSERQQT